MTTILIVDDMAVFREPIAGSLEARGYRTICAENGREAMEILRKEPPDLILLDVAMPVMDGLQFLEQMQENASLPQVPVILLTAVAERDYVLKAAKYGIRQYLLKSQFSLDELERRVRAVIETSSDKAPLPGVAEPGEASTVAKPSSVPCAVPAEAAEALDILKQSKPLLKKSDVLERFEYSGDLKAFSPTVAKILKLTSSGSSAPAEQIARAIRQDQGLAVRILKIANSSVYTRGEQVESIDTAVMRIGLTQIRQAILNVQVIDNFSSVSFGDQLTAGAFWEHAIACGLIAAEIAHGRSAEEADLAFTMGLMHDVGRLIFLQEFPEEYEQARIQAEELQLPLEVVEKRLLSVNHADAMDRLLHAWKFPRNLIDPIVFHHLSLGDMRHIAPRRVTEIATVALADRLTHALCIGSSLNDAIYPTDALCRFLKVSQSLIHHLEESVRQQTDDLKFSLISHGGGGGWEDIQGRYAAMLHQPLRPLFIGEHPMFDGYRIFCDLFTDRSEPEPNIAIVHITDPRDCSRLTQQLLREERERNMRDLPTLALSPTGRLSLEKSSASRRDCRLLRTPISVPRLMEAINGLLRASEECPHVPAA